jgi:hypothetical protein
MILAEAPTVLSRAPTLRGVADLPEATTAGRERREAERAIAYWERKSRQLGAAPTMNTLGVGAIHTEDWAHRFVIAIDPIVADSSLLMYGANFARLVNLPAKSVPYVPMALQLPNRLSKVFTRGCDQARLEKAPVRLEGEIDLADGRRELYRAAFIPVGFSALFPAPFTFGAFNSCVTM